VQTEHQYQPMRRVSAPDQLASLPTSEAEEAEEAEVAEANDAASHVGFVICEYMYCNFGM
jgi:hypothetical protein